MQNRIIWLGIIAAVLSQYAWLVPIPQFYLATALVALICAVVALMWTIIDRMSP